MAFRALVQQQYPMTLCFRALLWRSIHDNPANRYGARIEVDILSFQVHGLPGSHPGEGAELEEGCIDLQIFLSVA